MNHIAAEPHVQEVLTKAKNNTATGIDGCPYELWKALHQLHLENQPNNKPNFDISKTLTRVYQDIQVHGLEEGSSFAIGWMCPIYKKKD